MEDRDPLDDIIPHQLQLIEELFGPDVNMNLAQVVDEARDGTVTVMTKLYLDPVVRVTTVRHPDGTLADSWER